MSRNKLSFSIKGILLTLVGVIFSSIVFLNIKDAFLGAKLHISTASNGSTLTDNFLHLSGDARGAVEILINGRSINVDRKGKFEDGLLLSTGYNIVEVALKDRFGKTETKTYHWVVEPTSSVAKSSEIIN